MRSDHPWGTNPAGITPEQSFIARSQPAANRGPGDGKTASVASTGMSTPQPTSAPPGGATGGRRLVRLGSVAGVGIFVAPSWLFILAFVTLTYGDFLHQLVDGSSETAGYALALAFGLIIGASIVLHELGHTLVSLLVGVRVKRIVVFLLVGVSELDGEPRRPRDEFAIAAAGPLTSFVLAAVCWLLSLLAPDGSAPAVLLLMTAWSNLTIAVFNALPGLPLDGGRLLQAAVWRISHNRLTGIRIGAQAGRVLAGLLTLGVLFGGAAVRRSNADSFTFTVLGLMVAGFLWFGAGQSLRSAELADRTGQLHLSQLIRPAVYLPGPTPVSEALRYAGQLRATGIVVIDSDGRSRAIVDESQVAGLRSDQRPWTSVADVARPLQPGLILREDLPGEQVLAAVRRLPANEYLVIGSDGVSRGVLAASDLARALGLRFRTN